MNPLTSRVSRIFLTFALLSSVAALDFFMGYEVRIASLYALPIACATWYVGASLGVFYAVLAALASFFVERLSGKVFTAPWIGYVNMCSRFVMFVFVAYSFGYFKRTVDWARRRVGAFEGKFPVCCHCHRVEGGDGFWMDFPTYVRKNSNAVPEFKICPICARESSSANNSEAKLLTK